MRKTTIFRSFVIVLLGAALASAPAAAAGGKERKHPASPRSQERIVREVRHELVMLPYLTLFDHLAYRVEENGDTVVLMGAVMRPTLKSDAENVVKKIEGVERVVNNIDVLPLSPFDDDIRRVEYRAIYGYPALERYALGSLPSIHIIVKNGHVALEGEVDSQGDKNLVEIRAKGVPNVFSVTNNLQVASRSK